MQIMRRFFALLIGFCSFLAPALAQTGARTSTGTGFFITADGYAITCYHVVLGANMVSLRNLKGETINARVVATDKSGDLALLKAEGSFKPLAVVDSATVRRGQSVVTMGFPNVSLQGLEPKVTDGIVNSFSGANNDPRVFQVSAPVQQGNSGGPLIAMDGNVVGVIAAKLDAARVAQQTGDIPQNVNYAIKSAQVLTFLERVGQAAPDLKLRLADPKRDVLALVSDVVPALEDAIVLVVAGGQVAAAIPPAAAPAAPPAVSPSAPPVTPAPAAPPPASTQARQNEIAREYRQHQSNLNRLAFDEVALLQRAQLVGMMLRFDQSPGAADRRNELAKMQERLDEIGAKKAELVRRMNELATESQRLTLQGS